MVGAGGRGVMGGGGGGWGGTCALGQGRVSVATLKPISINDRPLIIDYD